MDSRLKRYSNDPKAQKLMKKIWLTFGHKLTSQNMINNCQIQIKSYSIYTYIIIIWKFIMYPMYSQCIIFSFNSWNTK